MVRLKFLGLVMFLFFSNSMQAQLSSHNSNGSSALGFHAGFVSLKHANSTFDIGRKHGPYFGLGIDIGYTNYEVGKIRYQLELKWTMDLFHKAIEFFKGTALDARVDLTGITWHKLGVNIFATDNICFALGGSFADYIVDVPRFVNEDGNFNESFTWQEPSGWNWTAGPCLFVDYGLSDFVFTFIGSYDFTYFTPIITQAYEDRTDKIEGYKPPHFMYLDLSVNHETGVYISLNRTLLLDKGELSNKISRAEIKFGWKWWI